MEDMLNFLGTLATVKIIYDQMPSTTQLLTTTLKSHQREGLRKARLVPASPRGARGECIARGRENVGGGAQRRAAGLAGRIREAHSSHGGALTETGCAVVPNMWARAREP